MLLVCCGGGGLISGCLKQQLFVPCSFFLWERLKIVVKPTGALAAAALLEGVVTAPNAKIGVIISGGNVDLAQVGKLFSMTNA